MDSYFLDELRAKCNEISAEEPNQEMISKTIDAYERILEFSKVARHEGLLALDEAKESLDVCDDTQKLFAKLIGLIVDGTESDVIRQISANMFASKQYTSYVGLINLMYIQGSLMIQAGENRCIISEILKSMMPTFVFTELLEREKVRTLATTKDKTKDEERRIESLCKYDDDIDEKDHSVIGETAKTLIMIIDQDIQRLLRDTDNNTVALAMKGLPGQARARIFSNVSKNTAIAIVQDMEYMGPVRLKDVEECCVSIMKTLLKLSSKWEIQEYDLSILKVVIDMYDMAQ